MDKKKRSNVGSLIFRLILIIVAGLTLGLSVYSWNAASVVGNQLPMPFGFGASVVLTGSMTPTLHVNDLVFVTEQDTYDTDDIVVYQDGNMLVIHRIISIDSESAVTQGDANNIADDPIELSQIKGKMVFRIPFIGLVFKHIKTVPGTLLVVLLAIYFLYRSRRKERDHDSVEKDAILQEIHRLRSQQAAESDPSDSKPSVNDNSADDSQT